MTVQTTLQPMSAIDRGQDGCPARAGVRMLVSSAGRRVALIRAFQSSADALGIDLVVFACDVAPEWSAACLAADHALAVPPAAAPDYAETVLALCEHHGITLVVPTIDTELAALGSARDRFAAAGVTVAVSHPDDVAMARDKLATACFLAGAGVPTPRTATAQALFADETGWAWPLFAKPRHGSSSRGIGLVHDAAQLAAVAAHEPYIVQEVLRGREYTVNLFFDRSGRLCSAVPHERVRVRAGEVEKGVTVRSEELRALAEALAAGLREPFGALCFQAIVPEGGTPSVFEINARFGGGYPLAHRAGATFARWLLEQQLDLPPTSNDHWQEGVVMLRYDDAVFL